MNRSGVPVISRSISRTRSLETPNLRATSAVDGNGVSISVFAISKSSIARRFLVRNQELAAAMQNLEADLALELVHGYLKPIEVDQNVALLAVVGEGMRGTRGWRAASSARYPVKT